MTEAEWQRCADPKKWATFLRSQISNRKLRLVACAFFRQKWHLLVAEQTKTAIDIAERFADGDVMESELQKAFEAAVEVANTMSRRLWNDLVIEQLGSSSVSGKETAAASWAASTANPNCLAWINEVTNHERRVELAGNAHLIREIVGNPFRPVTIDSRCLTSPVNSLAQVMYEERDFERMPILADALEDAGCTDPDILAHCRGPGPHVRGCWVVDLLLGKS